MFPDCDWSISLQLIPNRSAKSVTAVQKFVTTEEPFKFEIGKRECKFLTKQTNIAGKISEQLWSNLAGFLTKWIHLNNISKQ